MITLLVSCIGADPPEDDTAPVPACADETAPIWHPDVDGDGFGSDVEGVGACEPPVGYVATVGDCDDANRDVNPGAPEQCNGHDDNCDGRADDDASIDAPTWYRDADGDGWGTGEARLACTAPPSYVAQTGDCDDGDDDVYPAAEELCDPADVDEDCDGLAEDASALGRVIWYADADADGYGDTSLPVEGCDPPEDHVNQPGDCDDGDATVHPGQVEWCDGVDEDCDGTPDDDPLDPAVWWADSDADGFGDPDASVEACVAPAGTVANADDCDDTTALASPATAEACDGIDNDCDTTIDEDGDGASVWYLDGDADGFGDPGTAMEACDAPPVHVSDNTDCDDADAAVNPVAIERCNGVDDDCEGTADGADAIDATLWYADSDGDGFGDSATAEVACSPAAGFLADATDCDDTRADVRPGGQEVCDDADVDEDCDTRSDDADPDAIGQATWFADADADGFGAASDVGTFACEAPAATSLSNTDCDDTSARVSPDGTETCDGVDEDCDGVIDPDTAVDTLPWYADVDADGYGDPAVVTHTCVRPDGYADDAEDCDDAAASTHPGADEICNLVDEDCDGTADDDAVDIQVGWLDADGDGHGGPSSLTACELPAGYLLSTTDCDDTNADVSPDGTEVCDGADVDEDCDGLADDADPDVTERLSQWVDADGDGYGDGSAEERCDLSPGYAASPDDCDDADATVHPYAGETCDNFVDDDCDGDRDGCGWDSGTLDDADLTLTNTTANDYLGGVVAGGDLDADGYADLLVTAYGYDPSSSASNGGRTSVWFGPLGAETLATADATWTGSDGGDRLGFALAILDDDDANGLVEVAVGGDGYDGTASDIGAAWILEPTAGDTSSDDALATFTGASEDDGLGYSVAAGDLDGDGTEDVAFGAPGGGASDEGAVFAWLGPFAGDYNGNYADEIRDGAATSDGLGTTLAAADTDGDGVDELIVGAPYADLPGSSAGAVYIYTYDGGLTDVSAVTTLTGTATGDQLGIAVASAGDHDGDGLDDLLLGADLYDVGPTSAAGAAWLVFGVSTGIPSGMVTDVDGAALRGTATNDRAGGGVGAGGDVDGDGADDLLVGATRADGAVTDPGRVYLVYGPASGTIDLSLADVSWAGPHMAAYAGASVTILGDVDADGHDDIGVGVKSVDAGGDNAVGAAYVLYGAGW